MRDYEIAGAVILNEEKQLLLIQRAADEEKNPSVWEVPSGHVKPGESPREAAVREVREEAGLEVTLLREGIAFELNGDPGKYGVFYLSRVPGCPAPKLSAAHSAGTWFDLDDLSEIKPVHPNFVAQVQQLLRQSSHTRQTMAAKKQDKGGVKREKTRDVLKDLEIETLQADSDWESVWHLLQDNEMPDLTNFSAMDAPSSLDQVVQRICKESATAETPLHKNVREILDREGLLDCIDCEYLPDQVRFNPESSDATYRLVSALRKAGYRTGYSKSRRQVRVR